MRKPILMLAVAALTVSGCATNVHARSAHAGTASSAPLRCPATTPPVESQAGNESAPLAANPTAVVACLTNEPASKRAVIGAGARLPGSVAGVLARLIDAAKPADEATAKRCRPSNPLSLARFGYPSGATDVIVSLACPAGHVVYIRSRAYLVSALVAAYLVGATNPAAGALAPDLMGEPLVRAAATAVQAGDQIDLDGELVDDSAAGSVLLQEPTSDHRIDVLVAVHRSPPCRAGQLATQYLPGGGGAGNDFATIGLRNTSGSWCELDGPASVVGLVSGRPVTSARSVAVDPELELSPHAAASVPGRGPRADQLTASLSLSTTASCTARRVASTTWRLTLGSITLAVANGRAAAGVVRAGGGGLVSCAGQFGVAAIHLAIS